MSLIPGTVTLQLHLYAISFLLVIDPPWFLKYCLIELAGVIISILLVY